MIGTEIGATSPIPTTSSSPPVTNETATVISQIIIIGVAVGILVLLLAIVVVVVCLCLTFKKMKAKNNNNNDEGDEYIIEKYELK